MIEVIHYSIKKSRIMPDDVEFILQIVSSDG